jgi:hypothetical protein
MSNQRCVLSLTSCLMPPAATGDGLATGGWPSSTPDTPWRKPTACSISGERCRDALQDESSQADARRRRARRTVTAMTESTDRRRRDDRMPPSGGSPTPMTTYANELLRTLSASSSTPPSPSLLQTTPQTGRCILHSQYDEVNTTTYSICRDCSKHILDI